MTDTFLLLALARTGDQLQGIKKGVLELADIVAVNKADGPHELECKRAARELSSALHLIGQPEGSWRVPVLTCSAETGAGLEELWKTVDRHQAALRESRRAGPPPRRVARWCGPGTRCVTGCSTGCTATRPCARSSLRRSGRYARVRCRRRSPQTAFSVLSSVRPALSRHDPAAVRVATAARAPTQLRPGAEGTRMSELGPEQAAGLHRP